MLPRHSRCPCDGKSITIRKEVPSSWLGLVYQTMNIFYHQIYTKDGIALIMPDTKCHGSLCASSKHNFISFYSQVQIRPNLGNNYVTWNSFLLSRVSRGKVNVTHSGLQMDPANCIAWLYSGQRAFSQTF